MLLLKRLEIFSSFNHSQIYYNVKWATIYPHWTVWKFIYNKRVDSQLSYMIKKFTVEKWQTVNGIALLIIVRDGLHRLTTENGSKKGGNRLFFWLFYVSNLTKWCSKCELE